MLKSQAGLVVTFKLADLLQFYLATLTKILTPEVGLTRVLAACQGMARSNFDEQLAAQAHTLVHSPPVRVRAPACPHCLLQLTHPS